MKLEQTSLQVIGASEHYLRDITCTIPHDALTVISGVSGSGKSSLAFDTICREGQRRFLETLSVYARGFLGQMKQPACRKFIGLRPTMAVAQKGQQAQIRSTVGTMTDLYDSLRVLFASLGIPHCPTCKKKYIYQTENSIVDRLREYAAREPLTLLAPVIQGHRGSHGRELQELSKKGFEKARIDGVVRKLNPMPALDPKARHDIEVVVADKLIASDNCFEDRVKIAISLGRNVVLFSTANGAFDRLTCRYTCPECGNSPPEIGPRLFSFNSPYGACPSCQGLGVEDAIDPELLVGDPSRTVREGALVLTTPKGYIIYSQVTMDVLDQVCRAHEFTVDIPWNRLTQDQRGVILYGSDRIKIPFGKHPLESRLKWTGITARPREEEYYKGIIPTMDAILKRDRNPNILRFVRSTTCRSCGGSRLNPHAMAVTFHGESIASLSAMSLDRLGNWRANLSLNGVEAAVGMPILERVKIQSERLSGLGLGHLSINRSSSSLAAGEWQRIRLALQTFTELSGLLYVLDEPSLGLHPRDQQRLLDLLFHLRDSGNTVLAVEHRREALLSADRLIDLGPGAGPQGGRILFEGLPAEILSKPDLAESPTRSWLRAELQLPHHAKTENLLEAPVLQVIGASQHNLKNLDISFPLRKFIAVTGVSGAGKSTLVENILARHLRRTLHKALDFPGSFREIRGIEHVDKVIAVNQQPIGRTPRSNPATYTGVFDLIRDLFARRPLAKSRGWNKSRFSWNVVGGRCETCQGSGIQEIGLHLLDPVGITCEDCGGRRYLPETLEVTYHDRSISDVLNLTAAEALDLFSKEPAIIRILQAFLDVGLGYLTLGQSSTTISGGEAQRIKLATELARHETGRTVYILDEPATGLHNSDIKLLTAILRRLVDAGNTIIAVEHHPEFLLSADWLIDLGPEGGDQGGELVAAGTPETVMKHPKSHTGKALLRLIGQKETVFSPRPRFGNRNPDILLEGVTTHNLKNVSVSFPKNSLTVVTGVSGSGKSSLVMDTLLAESRHRYVESLSAYARRFVRQMERPSFAAAQGLTPVIAVGNLKNSSNPRSTVGTITGCLDFLRLLMSRVGTRHCPMCGRVVSQNGCSDCRFEPTLIMTAGMFSFNHADGACTNCHGMGTSVHCDVNRLITDSNRSLLDGAMDGTKTGRFYGERDGRYTAILATVGKELGHDFSLPWRNLTKAAQDIALNGCGNHTFKVIWKYRRGKRTGEHVLETEWRGFLRYVEEEYERKRADHRGKAMAELMKIVPCTECCGDRLKPEFRSVRWQNKSLGDLSRTPIERLGQMVQTWRDFPESVGIDKRTSAICGPLLAELASRIEWINLGGLGYLTTDRSVDGLSGGEFRRLMLASRLGDDITGVTYLLDEPTVGLHARDTARLIELLKRLRDLGNTVIVVEHDPDIIKAADYMMELGPGAGRNGGSITASGSWDEISDRQECLTAKWLSASAPWPQFPNHHLRHPGIIIRGGCLNNLRDLNIEIPLGGLVVVSGVSGSGKTTLVEDILLPSAETNQSVGCREFNIKGEISRVIMVDQQLPTGVENSLIATITGALDPIRDVFAKTDEARKRGLPATAFSPFGKIGCCQECKGLGGRHVDLDFLAEVRLTCEECGGSRFNREILDCRIRDHSVADILSLTINEAVEFFCGYASIPGYLEPMTRMGLGHLSLGRSTDTLSAGERQRLRLATALTKHSSKVKRIGSCLFLFDEPSVGLHLADVAMLLSVFNDLVAEGHSLVVVEHHLEIIRRADWVIDLGPGGGENGGRVVVAGPPKVVADHYESATGEALRVSYQERK